MVQRPMLYSAQHQSMCLRSSSEEEEEVTTEYLIKKIPDQNPVLRYRKNLQPVFES